MAETFLFVVSSHGELGSTGRKTGSWLEELAAVYWPIRDAGYAVVIASPRGGAAPLDPVSVEAAWISDAGRRFLADGAAMDALRSTVALDEIDRGGFVGLYLVGGAAATWDFPHNAVLKAMVEDHAVAGKVVGAICHGVIGLIQAMNAFGEPLIKNRSVTGISNAEEAMMGMDRIVPVLPEEMLRKLRGLYTAAPPLAPHVAVDPPFFTGQNPASAEPLAEAIVTHLKRSRAADAPSGLVAV